MRYDKVFAVGGSIYTSKLGKTPEIAEALNQHSPVCVVVGAGELKKNINAVKASEGDKDLIGIQATRLNARTLGTQMESHPKIPETAEEVKEVAKTEESIVMGGLNPGFSTDAVAAIAAELLDAELYIVTDIDGVYTDNPEKAGAEKLDEISVPQIKQIISGKSSDAGSYELIDRTALNIIERSEIPAKVMKGTVENLENPEEATGTEIIHEP
ncbi:MAG: UMP kinase [Candidatus Nanohalobium sp.]